MKPESPRLARYIKLGREKMGTGLTSAGIFRFGFSVAKIQKRRAYEPPNTTW